MNTNPLAAELTAAMAGNAIRPCNTYVPIEWHSDAPVELRPKHYVKKGSRWNNDSTTVSIEGRIIRIH